MNAITSQEARPLTAEELDVVSGGLYAVFYYGDFTMGVNADANGYQVIANNGCSTYTITQY
jgi:hypothetical protein